MARDRDRRLNKARGATHRLGSLQNPLDFMAEDHMREREVCTLIDRIVEGEPVDSKDIAIMRAFLIDDLPQHLADEECDLFPLMLERCDPDEEIDKMITRLQADHRHAIGDSQAIAALIVANADRKKTLSDTVFAKMSDFATHARRHLILENAILLPLARARLTKTDLETMRAHMLERRGQATEQVAGHAG